MRLAMAALLGGFFMLAGCAPPAHAHDSWINRNGLTDPVTKQWCCNEHDCEAEPVREVMGGYRVITGEVIPASRVLWKSQDGQWWRCRFMSPTAVDKDNKPMIGKTRCLIGPPPSM